MDNIVNNEEGAVGAAARARAERNRLRARALRDARLVQRPEYAAGAVAAAAGAAAGAREALSGGGFLREAGAGAGEARRPAQAPAPVLHRAEQPHCLHCDRPFPHSYLFDTFDYSVCDECRDDEGEHSLITRTEAKSEFLLKDCDLDARPPPLRCVRRRNPHRARFAEMRLYLRAQVERRALDVWGSREELAAERAARRGRAERAADTAQRRRLRALRMDVRSSLFDRTRAAHRHEFGAETHDPAADTYSRTCTECGHVETYEKM
ncbi:DNA repair protein complementing XP-A cells homolog [Epargyreus clarus]|uniref:DNA repair protein complementing XP-A cells homolog n=1 Tax=Epargyreus clarus TaxID=520877 RepID=UPI003C2ACD7D